MLLNVVMNVIKLERGPEDSSSGKLKKAMYYIDTTGNDMTESLECFDEAN